MNFQFERMQRDLSSLVKSNLQMESEYGISLVYTFTYLFCFTCILNMHRTRNPSSCIFFMAISFYVLKYFVA